MANTKTYAGVNGATVIEAVAGVVVSGFSYNNITAATVYTLYDNASAASGSIIWQGTLAAATADTVVLSKPVTCRNGLTVNTTNTANAGSFFLS